MLIIQIVYGAFVAGMHAGKIYNTWPLMDGQIIPSGIMGMSPLIQNFFDNQVLVQFLHRLFAILIVLMILQIWLLEKKQLRSRLQKRGMNFLLLAVVFQFLLGVLTLLTQVNITLASLHQVGAFFLFSATIFLLFHYRNQNTAATIG